MKQSICDKRDLPNNVVIGEFTYINNAKIHNATIGKFCSIANGVNIGIGIHPTNEFISTHPAFFSKNNSGALVSFTNENLYTEFKHITIGNDVWIGLNAILLDGIKIGDGAIIAAGAVVTKDVEPYSIVGGIPAKHIKYRFTKERRETLLSFQWWNKPLGWIMANVDIFQSDKFFDVIKNNTFRKSLNLTKEEICKSIKNNFYMKKEVEESLEFSKQFNKFYAQIYAMPHNLILYGNGVVSKTIQKLIPEKIVGYVDINDEEHHPKNLKKIKYEKVLITVLGRENEVIYYLANDLGIIKEKIITLEV